MKKAFVRAAVLAGACASLWASTDQASVVATWGGGATGNWSSTTAPAGWSNGTVPNGQGDSATYTAPNSATTTQDVAGGVTVGTIKVDGTTNSSWQITPTNDVIMNQDGAGPGTASIINAIQSTGATGNPAIFINNSTGWLTLQDDLLISNTSNSARTTGAVQMKTKIQGAGNITIENVSNNPAVAAVVFSGQGNFAGNTTVAKGATTFTRGDNFSPSPGNVVTIGRASSGDATLVFAGTTVNNMENNFVAAANTGGTSVFGASTTLTGGFTVKSSSPTSSIRLDGDLSLTNGTAGQLVTIGDPITGVGKLTKIGVGPVRLTNGNSYQGGTVVSVGSLSVGTAPDTNNGFGFYPATVGSLGSGDVTVSATATDLEIETGVTNAIGDAATLSLAGGGTAGAADVGYALLDSGVNEVVGNLVLGGVAMPAGTYGSSSSLASNQLNEYFSGPGIVTVVSTPEPGSVALLGLGAAGALARRRRRV